MTQPAIPADNEPSPDNPFQFTDLGEFELTAGVILDQARGRSQVFELLLWLFPNFVLAMVSCVWSLLVARGHVAGPIWTVIATFLLFLSLYATSQRRVRLLLVIKTGFLTAGSVWMALILRLPGMNPKDASIFLIMALLMCALNMIHLAVSVFTHFRDPE